MHKKIPKDFSLDISALFLFIIEMENEEKGQKITVAYPICPPLSLGFFYFFIISQYPPLFEPIRFIIFFSFNESVALRIVDLDTSNISLSLF